MPHTEAEIEQWMQVYDELNIQIAEVKINHTIMTMEQRKERNSLYARIRYNTDPEVRAKHREYYLKQNPNAIEYKKNVKRPTRRNDTRAPHTRNTPIRTRINNSQTIQTQIKTETIEQLKKTVEDKPQICKVKFGF